MFGVIAVVNAGLRHDELLAPPPTVAAPEDVSVVPGNGKVTVVWSPVQGAEGYRIYRGVNGVWIATPVGRTTGTSHTSYGLANGTTYSFTVAAYTKDGNGPLSLAVSAMPIAPPQGVTAAMGDGRVTINWQPSAGATSYTIYRKVGRRARIYRADDRSVDAAVRRSRLDQRHAVFLSASRDDRRFAQRVVRDCVRDPGAASAEIRSGGERRRRRREGHR